MKNLQPNLFNSLSGATCSKQSIILGSQSWLFVNSFDQLGEKKNFYNKRGNNQTEMVQNVFNYRIV